MRTVIWLKRSRYIPVTGKEVISNRRCITRCITPRWIRVWKINIRRLPIISRWIGVSVRLFVPWEVFLSLVRSQDRMCFTRPVTRSLPSMMKMAWVTARGNTRKEMVQVKRYPCRRDLILTRRSGSICFSPMWLGICQQPARFRQQPWRRDLVMTIWMIFLSRQSIRRTEVRQVVIADPGKSVLSGL